MCNHAHMEWNDLQLVLAVHRAGTFLGASRSLGVSHTTVSRRMATLEADLGARLFHRSPDGLQPTPAGAALARTAARVEDEVLGVEGEIRGRDARLEGPLRVSSVPALMLAFPELTQGFAAQHPHVALDVDLTGEPASLFRQEADVVTRMSNDPPETLVGRRIGPIQFGVYASRPRWEADPAAPLSAYPWIGRNGGPNLAWFDTWLSANAPGARIVVRMPYEPVHVLGLVRQGVGAQILPCFLADADPAVARIAPLDPLFRLDLWLLTLPELRTNRRVGAFLDHAAGVLTAARGRLAGGAEG